ncbi:MAG: DUF5060 domain-containing protein, partial [Dehalococcoidia bacterium]|nr:DUF5060 domain-containing protein [Dehalococcoidia bacterium]
MSGSRQASVERWDIFETSFTVPQSEETNAFADVDLTAIFRFRNREVHLDGFYDGDGVFKIRFMPDEIGSWSYETRCDQEPLNGQVGQFECTAPSEGNHGPMRVADTFHFRYEDGTPYIPVG